MLCNGENYDCNRIQYMDVAKGIGILCVVAGHTQPNYFSRIVYPFHMPLFFLISGYFLSLSGNIKDFIKKKFRQLIIPYFITCIALMLETVIYDCMKLKADSIFDDLYKRVVSSIYGGHAENLPFGIEKVGFIWFLPALLIAIIIVRIILEKFGGGIKGTIIILIFAIVGLLTSDIFWMPCSFQAGMFSSLFVYFGFILKKYDWILENKFFGIVYISTIVFWLIEIKYDVILSSAGNFYPIPLLSVFVAIMMSCLVIHIAKYLKKGFLFRCLCFYGTNSMIILCVHTVEIRIFPWKSVAEFLQKVFTNMLIATVVQYIIHIILLTCMIKGLKSFWFYLKKSENILFYKE